MNSQEIDVPIPEFVFVCGAVDSGNTFMFNCITQDENVFGVNEDALGSTLDRLLLSEQEMGKCPHSVDAFVDFMYALRHDRRTLVLKTPSNIRYTKSIRKYLPKSRFILMIREPHAAIVSGLERHGVDCTVERAARIWLSDRRFYTQLDSDSIAVAFEDLVTDPTSTLRHVSDRILPLSPSVLTYAARMYRPERAKPAWWQAKVDERVRKEMEHWVEKLDLSELYRSAGGTAKSSEGQPENSSTGFTARSLVAPLVTAKKEFFRAWYRLIR